VIRVAEIFFFQFWINNKKSYHLPREIKIYSIKVKVLRLRKKKSGTLSVRARARYLNAVVNDLWQVCRIQSNIFLEWGRRPPGAAWIFYGLCLFKKKKKKKKNTPWWWSFSYIHSSVLGSVAYLENEPCQMAIPDFKISRPHKKKFCNLLLHFT